MRNTLQIGTVIGSLSLLLLAGCGSSDEDAAVIDQISAVTVYHAQVRVENIVDPIMATGEVTADKRTDIKARVDGIIEEIYVDVGDQVSAGDPLLKTRQLDYASRAAEAKHALELARVELAQAEREYGRALPLREKGVVSQGRMDRVMTQHQIAKSRFGIAEASLARAQQDLSDTIVRAPYDGIITARHIDEGTLMKIATGGTPAVEIIKLDVVEVVARLPAVHLSKIREGSRVTVLLDGFAVALESTLAVINDRIDTRTRSAEVRVRLDNPDLAIKPGLFAKVSLYPAPRSAIVLDRKAVLGLSGDNFVFVPDGGVARRRPVTVRDIGVDEVEVLSGLAVGEVALIGPNLPDLKDGSPIKGVLQVHGSR
jgi:RND family efflux transporter MFP subunit